MAERSGNRAVIYAVIGAIVVIAVIAFFALAPVRRPRPTINGAPPEGSTTNLTGGPVNGVGPMGVGNRPVNAQ